MARKTRFRRVAASLADLVGGEVVEAAVRARAALTGERPAALRRVATEKVDFFPRSLADALTATLPKVGRRITKPLAHSAGGATSRAFAAASKSHPAPVTGWGYYRVGEDGRVYFLSKSEHYHAPLGHGFPGYRLVEMARRLGVPNATHNNTRGAITRRLEEELVRTVHGIAPGDRAGLAKRLASRAAGALNRVLNLETGSLACEAGLKMMLGRFHRPQPDSPAPKYAGRTPVIVVIGDDDGGPEANYHGTTLVAQVLRGMWPDWRTGLERAGLMRVVSVRPDDRAELEAVFARYDRGRTKIAGLCHELVLMNYGARRLDRRFVRRMYTLCRAHDVPVLVDEIQTCMWSPQLYMFREYGVRPDLVVLGKGFPGGEYPASRIVFGDRLDCLPQFGALVTNGQEELASLAYLVTMRWAEANAEVTRSVGEAYEASLARLVDAHPRLLAGVDGWRHMASMRFYDLAVAKAFTALLNEAGLDISVQAYKASCPPGALTKLPLIAGHEAAAMVVERMEAALRQL